MQSIDLNCDMGEGMANDALIMPFISSANIACGYHAGDSDTMRRTVVLAMQHGVAIGAHPSFDDRANFGRTEQRLTEQQLYDLIIAQLKDINTIANAVGATLHHVKPHGALYNMAARDAAMSETIVRAISDFDQGLVLYGLSGSKLMMAAKTEGLRFASEIFADRTYQDDGSLTPRSQPGALIGNEEDALQQVLQMIKKGTVNSIHGNEVTITAETVCIHGDGVHAVAFAKKIYEALKLENIEIRAIS